jgi:hypothetical protein
LRPRVPVVLRLARRSVMDWVAPSIIVFWIVATTTFMSRAGVALTGEMLPMACVLTIGPAERFWYPLDGGAGG